MEWTPTKRKEVEDITALAVGTHKEGIFALACFLASMSQTSASVESGASLDYDNPHHF